MKRLIPILFVLLATPLYAQTANPSAVTFTSMDQNTLIPAGQVGAGGPLLTGYQANLFLASTNVGTNPGTPLQVGPVVPKAAVTAQTTANSYGLTFQQLGITTPACATLPCTQYSIVLVAIGPGGTTAIGVSSESDPFTAKVPTLPSAPAAPVNVKTVP